jgi:hypothetical protein
MTDKQLLLPVFLFGIGVKRIHDALTVFDLKK